MQEHQVFKLKTFSEYLLRTRYKTYFHPHLEFCASVLNPYNIGDIEDLESVQGRAS